MLTVILVLSTVFTVNVFAATSGGKNTSTIYVETKANWLKAGSESITLKQDKATYTYQEYKLSKGWVTKSKSIYPTYDITIKNITKGKTETKTWKDKSIKLKLDRNCTYQITVSYNGTSTWYRSNSKLGNYVNYPHWYVSKTNKVSYYR